jgi:hypothetical protein
MLWQRQRTCQLYHLPLAKLEKQCLITFRHQAQNACAGCSCGLRPVAHNKKNGVIDMNIRIWRKKPEIEFEFRNILGTMARLYN